MQADGDYDDVGNTNNNGNDGNDGARAQGNDEPSIESRMRSLAADIDAAESGAAAKYAQIISDFKEQTAAARRGFEEYVSGLEDKYDAMRKDMDSRLDAARQEAIQLTMTASGTEPAHPAPEAGADDLFKRAGVDAAEFRKFVDHPYFMYPGKKGVIYVMSQSSTPSSSAGGCLIRWTTFRTATRSLRMRCCLVPCRTT